MIKGVNRQIIEVCDCSNIYFEKVLLFVRPQLEQKEQAVLEKEANRLVEGFGRPPKAIGFSGRRRKQRRNAFIRSVVWCGVGAAICALLQMVF